MRGARRKPLVDNTGLTAWVTAMVECFSIRRTTVEGNVEPAAHEITVIVAAQLWRFVGRPKARPRGLLASRCWWVVRAVCCAGPQRKGPPAATLFA